MRRGRAKKSARWSFFVPGGEIDWNSSVLVHVVYSFSPAPLRLCPIVCLFLILSHNMHNFSPEPLSLSTCVSATLSLIIVSHHQIFRCLSPHVFLLLFRLASYIAHFLSFVFDYVLHNIKVFPCTLVSLSTQPPQQPSS